MSKDPLAYIPLLYTSLWFVIHYIILGSDLPLFLIALPLSYGIGHYMAAKHTKLIGLSADIIAVPLVIAITAGIVITTVNFYDVSFGSKETIIHLIKAIIYSYIITHVVSLSVFSLYSEFFEESTGNRSGIILLVMLMMTAIAYGYATGHVILALVGIFFGWFSLISGEGLYNPVAFIMVLGFGFGMHAEKILKVINRHHIDWVYLSTTALYILIILAVFYHEIDTASENET